MSTKLDRLTELAKEEPKRQFFSIAHLITPEALYAHFEVYERKPAQGWTASRIRSTKRTPRERSKSFIKGSKTGSTKLNRSAGSTYRKENGKQQTDLDSAVEDKIVQKGMVEVLNAIYEQDFLDCSYGFRPGRGQHQALDEGKRVICTRSTGWILELDITAYFDSIGREQLMEMIEKRCKR